MKLTRSLRDGHASTPTTLLAFVIFAGDISPAKITNASKVDRRGRWDKAENS